MPVSVLRRHRLGTALAVLCATPASFAQQLPRREGVENIVSSRLTRDEALDRHVGVQAASSLMLDVPEGGPLVDLEVKAGVMPRVLSSQGGALLVERTVQPLSATRAVVDTGADGPRWLMLDGGEGSRVEAHVRHEPAPGGADPWRVPIDPDARQQVRDHAGRRDHVVIAPSSAVHYTLQGERHVRFDIWRQQQPRLLPPDATWLRIEVDGRVVFDGRPPTPALRERLSITEGCAVVLDLAGRVRIDLPPGARRMRIHAEPGTWLRALSPLPGTPAHALGETTTPAHERFVQRPDESFEAVFARAVEAFPDARAQVFLGRYSYYRDVAIAPVGGTLRSRFWRVRLPDRETRDRPAVQRPEPGRSTMGGSTFHWLAPGATWHLALPLEARAGLLRITAAHLDGSTAPRLALRVDGSADRELRMPPALVRALRGRGSPMDALLAVDPAGDPVVDASEATFPIPDLRGRVELVNRGEGMWLAVEHRVPAGRRIAREALGPVTLDPARLRNALLDRDAPAPEAPEAPASTRAITQARELLLARAALVADDPCVAPADRAGAAGALRVAAIVHRLDTALARCASLRGYALAPEDDAAWEVLDRWARDAARPELRTAVVVHGLQKGRPAAASAGWSRLAHALEAEGELEAAALATLASGHPDPHWSSDIGSTLPPAHAAAATRLRTERGTEIPYALAHTQPATWIFPEAGDYRVELRSFSRSPVPHGVRLRSGDRTWTTRLPGVDPTRSSLRELASGAAPGSAVIIPVRVPEGGLRVDVEATSAPVLARVESMVPLRRRDALGADQAHAVPVQADVADRCRIHGVQATIAVARVDPPDALPAPRRPIEPSNGAPLLPERGAPGNAGGFAVAALAAFDRGEHDEALRHASRALQLREAATDTGTSHVFDMLDDAIDWKRVEPLAHGGRVSREVADGHSTQPVLARREQLAGPTGDDRFLMREGQGWVLEGLEPGQRVELELQQHAALPGGSVEVRLTRGVTRGLGGGVVWNTYDNADSDGELHLRIGDALPGTFVSMRLSDANGVTLDARREVAYHRGPLRIGVAGPTLLRVVEWNGRETAVRMQWVDAAGHATVRAETLPGAALRVSQPVVAARGTATGSAPPAVAPLSVTASTLPATPRAPAATQASTWPGEWPASGGGDHTWGFSAALRERLDADETNDGRERFGELRARYRYHPRSTRFWGRTDAVARRHDAGFGVVGLDQRFEWHRGDGLRGVGSAWLELSGRLQSAPAPGAPRPHSREVQAGAEWQRSRDERWRDEWEVSARWRRQSLHDVPRAGLDRVDNEVYSRYREDHPHQLELGYRLTWRARYDTEWVISTRAATNRIGAGSFDHAGAGLEWRWARQGWLASASVQSRHYFRDEHRSRAFRRDRLEADASRLFLSWDTGWRVRMAAGYDLRARQAFGGVQVEWFDHDGRALDDFLPSETALRDITLTDLLAPMVPRMEGP